MELYGGRATGVTVNVETFSATIKNINPRDISCGYFRCYVTIKQPYHRPFLP
jgi:hypothetical protein